MPGGMATTMGSDIVVAFRRPKLGLRLVGVDASGQEAATDETPCACVVVCAVHEHSEAARWDSQLRGKMVRSVNDRLVEGLSYGQTEAAIKSGIADAQLQHRSLKVAFGQPSFLTQSPRVGKRRLSSHIRTLASLSSGSSDSTDSSDSECSTGAEDVGSQRQSPGGQPQQEEEVAAVAAAPEQQEDPLSDETLLRWRPDLIRRLRAAQAFNRSLYVEGEEWSPQRHRV